MNIIYNRLFNLSIGHDYYQNGLAKGIALIPTGATRTLIKGGRMLFKVVKKGIVVLYRTMDDEVTPFVDGGKDQRFTFAIKVDNSQEFQNITELDESPTKTFQSSNILYFKNDPANASTDPSSKETLTHQILDSLRAKLFTYSFIVDPTETDVLFEVANESGTLISVGKDVDGTPFPTTLTLSKDDNNIYEQQIDLRSKPGGKYTITIRKVSDNSPLKEELIYLDDELATQKVVGVVDMLYDTAGDHIYGDTEEYALQFARKETVWKYFIVNKNNQVDLGTDGLFITDTSGDVGNPYDTYGFTLEGAAPNTTIRINDLDTVIFKSDTPLPFFELPKLKLELMKNVTDPVLEHLPNPSHGGVIKDNAGTPESEIYVFI